MFIYGYGASGVGINATRRVCKFYKLQKTKNPTPTSTPRAKESFFTSLKFQGRLSDNVAMKHNNMVALVVGSVVAGLLLSAIVVFAF